MRRVVKTVFLLSLFLGAILFTTPVFTSGPNIPTDLGLGATANSSNAGGQTLQNKFPTSVPTIIGNALGVVLAFLGVIFFLLTLYAGFTWMLAHGKEDYTQKAKNTLVSASIGLLIVLGAYAITRFIFSTVEDTPAPVTNPEQPPVAGGDCNQQAFIRCQGGCPFIDCSAPGVNCEENYVPKNLDQACLFMCASDNNCHTTLRQ